MPQTAPTASVNRGDTHLLHENLHIPDGDVLIHGGDLSTLVDLFVGRKLGGFGGRKGGLVCFCLFGVCCCCSDDGGSGGEPPFSQHPCVLVCFKQHLQHTCAHLHLDTQGKNQDCVIFIMFKPLR